MPDNMCGVISWLLISSECWQSDKFYTLLFILDLNSRLLSNVLRTEERRLQRMGIIMRHHNMRSFDRESWMGKRIVVWVAQWTVAAFILKELFGVAIICEVSLVSWRWERNLLKERVVWRPMSSLFVHELWRKLSINYKLFLLEGSSLYCEPSKVI